MASLKISYTEDVITRNKSMNDIVKIRLYKFTFLLDRLEITKIHQQPIQSKYHKSRLKRSHQHEDLHRKVRKYDFIPKT